MSLTDMFAVFNSIIQKRSKKILYVKFNFSKKYLFVEILFSRNQIFPNFHNFKHNWKVFTTSFHLYASLFTAVYKKWATANWTFLCSVVKIIVLVFWSPNTYNFNKTHDKVSLLQWYSQHLSRSLTTKLKIVVSLYLHETVIFR